MPRQIHNLKGLETTRKELRNNATPAEAALWRLLQKGQIEGRKFRRQHSIGKFVLDFYCSSEKLAIELNGAPHFTYSGAERDYEKIKFVESLNIRVLRFENKFVFEQPDSVIEEIKRNFKSILE